jgi:hypothetical protein
MMVHKQMNLNLHHNKYLMIAQKLETQYIVKVISLVYQMARLRNSVLISSNHPHKISDNLSVRDRSYL